jgi:hypothetical protein
MSTICLGMLVGLPHLGMAGWGVFISPNTKLAIGEKLCSRWYTGECTIHCLVRPAVGLTPQATVGSQAFTPDTPDVTLDSPMVFSPQCHLELAIELLFPSAPDSPACGIGHSGVPRTVWCSRPYSL